MFRTLLLAVAALLITGVAAAQNFGTIQGKVTEESTGEPVMFCSVLLTKGGQQAGFTETDLDGNYSIGNLDPGEYEVEFAFLGYTTQKVENVRVTAGRVISVNMQLSEGLLLDEVVVTAYEVPLVEQDNTTQGKTITGKEIRALPLKDVNAIAASTAGVSTIDGEAVAIRGSRANATDYYIDGVRVIGALVPQYEIEQMQVITGGLEAMYGDVSGGVISITTKGPASRFGGAAEMETSQFLDPYNYNELNLALSGPLVTKNNRSIVGYRLSGRYRNIGDQSPAATGIYAASPDLISQLEQNPLSLAGSTPFNTAEALQIDNDQIQLLDARPNSANVDFDIVGRIDARLSDAIDISLGGSYRQSANTFVPDRNWALYNWQRNPTNDFQHYRTNFRFRHRLGSSRGFDEEGRRQTSVIQNAVYTIQVGYEKSFSSQQDPIHGDNLFRYGHVGTFDRFWTPEFGQLPPGITGPDGEPLLLGHAGYLSQMEGAYTPSPYNPVLANFNNVMAPQNLNVFDRYINVNGILEPNFTSLWGGLHSNVGRVFNTFFQGESDVFTLNANAQFDFLPGGSEKGRHSIQFGILYEQRIQRSYNVAPIGLYNIARLRQNVQINGVDYLADPIGTHPDGWDIFPTLIVEPEGGGFYRNVRERFGVSINDHFNIDGISPDDLSLDLFQPQELTDLGAATFVGYDYLGQRVSSSTRFNDFFTVNEDGSRDFLVAPQAPIYQAFFIQDKFTYKDIIFRLGLRVDYFDNNTKVMRDPLSLYPIMTAEDFFTEIGGDRPGVVQDDWRVYVTGEGSNVVKAFRDGEQWFDANGTPVNDGNLIWGGELVTPRFYDDNVNNIKSPDFDPDRSFVDYTPQINWMPRIAVSFPISDESNFFAHYDILVQRPPTNSFLSPLNFYYFEDIQGLRNNPALRPERTVDYEVGFQQRLTSASAIKISAFYRELRDMIQYREILYVPPPVNRYGSFDNIDFGTVKGFSFNYELRRTKNISLNANYTLQFADGTGSDATSQRGIALRGNLRTLFPLARDERHAIRGVFDFRFDEGKRYNGPRWFGKDVFANSGFNFQFNAISGRPYTRNQRPQPFGGTGFAGSINGARLPWNFTIDLRVEKSWRINKTEAANPAFATLSLRVLNLLDTRNIIGVFPVTGSPFDSGFISGPDGQAAINTAANAGSGFINAGRDENAYLASYQWASLFPNFFTLPRRIFLAALFDF